MLSKDARIEIYTTIILYVVYESETWSLTLKDGTEKELSKGKALRRVLGSKGKEKIGRWIKLHNYEFYDFYTLE
jgi:hypothetical protein